MIYDYQIKQIFGVKPEPLTFFDRKIAKYMKKNKLNFLLVKNIPCLKKKGDPLSK